MKLHVGMWLCLVSAAACSKTQDSTNTKLNERDREGDTVTPIDQGGSEKDLKITQRIRQAVVDDDTLSFAAKNVKIVTLNDKVTLRGPVDTAEERSTIEAAARRVAAPAEVDNQLEVKK